MAKLSNAVQESYVAQGLALGVLAAGVDRLPADKLAFESAFSHAWADFAGAPTFPRVGHPHAADPYYAVVGRSNRRKGPLMAAWDNEGQELIPYVWHDEWDIEESGEMLAGWAEVTWADWQALGADLVDYYREHDLL